tara:strand:+ start:3319 stop:4383 length:1065 start_codon:yes stop_codon:yes gene_type:complete
MKKISLILITFLLITGVSGFYGYFVFFYEEENSNSEESIGQQELIEHEESSYANNQTASNDTEESDEELPFDVVGIFKCIEIDSEQRCWQTHEPSGSLLGSSVPLVVDLHGYGFNSTEHRRISDFDAITSDENAVVLYPDALDFSWNSGWCCAASKDQERDDLGFILEMVEIAINFHNIDASRIYVTGWSNGCAMAQALANKASSVFAAVGCMSWYLLQEADNNYSPIPIIELHGILDLVIPYASDVNGGLVHGQVPSSETASGAIQNMYNWKEMNGCNGNFPDVNEQNMFYSIQGFSDCENNAQVRLVTLHAHGHNPYSEDAWQESTGIFLPGSQIPISTSQIAWDFISQYSK